MLNFKNAKLALAKDFLDFDLGKITSFGESAWNVGSILLRRRAITNLPEWAIRDIVLNLTGSFRTAEVERWIKALLAFLAYRSEILGIRSINEGVSSHYVMPRVIRGVLRRAAKAEKLHTK